jgi:hypothetical protein
MLIKVNSLYTWVDMDSWLAGYSFTRRHKNRVFETAIRLF